VKGDSMKTHIKLIIIYIICHLISYFAVSFPYYQLLLKPYYVGPSPILSSFLITESDLSLWSNSLVWLVPIQILSAFLFSLVFLFIIEWLTQQSFWKVFFFLFWCRAVLGGIASILPAPGSLEGFLFLKPDIHLSLQVLVGIEILMEALLVSLLFCSLYFKFGKPNP
jgi:hypothetical protein